MQSRKRMDAIIIDTVLEYRFILYHKEIRKYTVSYTHLDVYKRQNLKGVYGTNQVAVKALVDGIERGKREGLTVVGYDADEEQLQMLKDGTVDGLLVQNPFGMGYASVIAAARAAIGAGNEAYVNTGYVWVTKDNMKNEEVKQMLAE